MTFVKAELEAMAQSVPCWFHSIDFGEGVVTNGWKSGPHLDYEINSFRLPDLRGKTVLDINADFMEMDVERLGTFDVVFYFGSLYHMENPLGAMKRVAIVAKELAIIETEAVLFRGLEHHALCEFFESNELNGDVSNWWAPNEKALAGLCRAAGFSRVESVVGPPPVTEADPATVIRYRSVVHAWK